MPTTTNIIQIYDLRVEGLTEPTGLGVACPRFSWKTKADTANWKQQAYQIRAISERKDLGSNDSLVWDSEKVNSEQSIHVPWGGEPLQSEQTVFWQIRVWDTAGNVSDWSQPGMFQLALLSGKNWRAHWITVGYEEDLAKPKPATYYRREFSTKPALNIRSATAHVSARGLYELHLNGNKISNDHFTPGWTSYQHRLQFQSYDVTDALVTGKNCISSIVGDGWFRSPFTWQIRRNLYGEKTALICQLHIEYGDGSEDWVLSNTEWKCSTGPILKSEIYDGETYDAREEISGWNQTDMDDSAWQACALAKDQKLENLIPSCSEPVRCTKTLSPQKIFTTPKGETVLDFGQNLVGWVSFKLRANAGDRIVIDHAEVLDQEGNFNTENLRQAKQRIHYTFKGHAEGECYHPHFTFMGFRYIRISEFPHEIPLSAFEAQVLHTDMQLTGEFSCSDSRINQLQSNIQWGMRGNFLDVPTDCPQRDERMGWTGDAQVFTPTACFNANVLPFFKKWLKDLSVDQRKDGSVPWVVPNVVGSDGGGTGWSDGFGSTAWADAATIIPWELYKKFGDISVLEDQYESMKAWVDYMVHHSKERFIFDHGFHFGDWLSFAEYMNYDYAAPDYGFAGAHTDKDLIATAYFYWSTNILSQTADILNQTEDSRYYASLLPHIQDAFEKEFVTETGRLSSNTQTAYAISLHSKILPKRYRESALRRLEQDIHRLGHLTTGFVGTPILNNTLSENGCSEAAYRLLFNDRYPSWLFPISRGATTIWERWDGIKPDGSFQTVGMNSFNHYAYGSVGDWLYSYVAGLQADIHQPGFKHFSVRPCLSPMLDWVDLKFESPYGPIRIHWELVKNCFQLEVEVPPNTTASINVPNKRQQGDSTFSIPVSYEIHQIGSGKHTYASTL